VLPIYLYEDGERYAALVARSLDGRPVATAIERALPGAVVGWSYYDPDPTATGDGGASDAGWGSLSAKLVRKSQDRLKAREDEAAAVATASFAPPEDAGRGTRRTPVTSPRAVPRTAAPVAPPVPDQKGYLKRVEEVLSSPR